MKDEEKIQEFRGFNGMNAEKQSVHIKDNYNTEMN